MTDQQLKNIAENLLSDMRNLEQDYYNSVIETIGELTEAKIELIYKTFKK